MLIGLAFVPESDVFKSYLLIKQWAVNQKIENLEETYLYFENIYVGTSNEEQKEMFT
jgi:hypothetical protein